MSGSVYGSDASVLAPIMVGLHTPDPDAETLRRCWQVAALSVPATRVPATRVPAPVPVLRSHTVLTTADSAFVLLAKLVEVVPDEPVWAALRWRWMLGARVVEPGTVGEPFTHRATVYRIETLSYRVRNGAVAQAPQLALFRHALVDALRASRPDVVVAGGQHDWRDEWWAAAPSA